MTISLWSFYKPPWNNDFWNIDICSQYFCLPWNKGHVILSEIFQLPRRGFSDWIIDLAEDFWHLSRLRLNFQSPLAKLNNETFWRSFLISQRRLESSPLDLCLLSSQKIDWKSVEHILGLISSSSFVFCYPSIIKFHLSRQKKTIFFKHLLKSRLLERKNFIVFAVSVQVDIKATYDFGHTHASCGLISSARVIPCQKFRDLEFWNLSSIIWSNLEVCRVKIPILKTFQKFIKFKFVKYKK